MPTTYRVVLETETRPREAAVVLDHMPAIQVDAPNVDVAARLALSHHIDSRPTPAPAGTSFGPLVIAPPPYDPKVPLPVSALALGRSSWTIGGPFYVVM